MKKFLSFINFISFKKLDVSHLSVYMGKFNSIPLEIKSKKPLNIFLTLNCS